MYTVYTEFGYELNGIEYATDSEAYETEDDTSLFHLQYIKILRFWKYPFCQKVGSRGTPVNLFEHIHPMRPLEQIGRSQMSSVKINAVRKSIKNNL